MMRSKYGAVKTVRDGITFDSKLEADRLRMLKALEQLGRIYNLERQVKFPLMVNGVKIGDYVADFRYIENPSWDPRFSVIEDAKGILTPVCRWKLKHMAAQGNTVTLWPAPTPRKTRRKAIK